MEIGHYLSVHIVLPYSTYITLVMIIYNSMILWIIFLMVLTQNRKISVRYRDGTTRSVVPWSVALLATAYITFWPAIRSGVADTAAYILSFCSQNTGWDAMIKAYAEDQKAPMWLAVLIIFKTFISTNYHWWLAFIAILSMVPIMRTLRKRSDNFLYSMLMFMLMMYFTWLLNGIRQFIVAAIAFSCCHFIERNKPILWILAIWALSTIHTTVIILMPIYYFARSKSFGKLTILYTLGLMLIAVFVSSFMDLSGALLANSAYAGNLEQFAEDDGVHPLRVAIMLVPVLMAFVKRNEIWKANDLFLNLSINMSVLSVGIYFIGMFTSGIMIGRLPIFFELYNLILIPALIERYYQNNKNTMYVLVALLFGAFYYLLSGNLYYISDLTGLVK